MQQEKVYLNKMQHFAPLKRIFQASVNSVLPERIFDNKQLYDFNMHPETGTIKIKGSKINIADKQCHIVGFGKAVLGMAVSLQSALGPQLKSGILSVPVNAKTQFAAHIKQLTTQEQHQFEIFEGAANNLPDEAAMETAIKIKSFVQTLKADDVLFVLISGGGSALLPLPRPPLTLAEKYKLVKDLQAYGAHIIEINIVRIAISMLKGGQLAMAARNASEIVTLILSDVIDDPVAMIASGPTVEPIEGLSNAHLVLKKYNLWKELPKAVKDMINSPPELVLPKYNKVFVVGNNELATTAAQLEATRLGYCAFVATNSIAGPVRDLPPLYCSFMETVICFRKHEIDEDEFKIQYPFDLESFPECVNAIHESTNLNQPLLIIIGGEPTVQVTGKGIGGRNQELALQMSLAFKQNLPFKKCIFMSAGTDGIDGPTIAAGAFGADAVINDYLLSNPGHRLENIIEHIKNNDSFNFYKKLNDGLYHIITGHTGTNVADLHFIVMP